MHQESNPTPTSTSTRRSFIGALIGIGAACMGVLLSIPLFRFAVFPLRHATSEAEWTDLGPVSDLAGLSAPIERTVTIRHQDGWRLGTTQQSVYVFIGHDGKPHVLSSICPHLGCPVHWVGDQGRFICPCHGGIFAPDGARLAGPPARGMDELPTRIQNGHLLMQFQYFRQLLPYKELTS